jgi:hypothetical protein
VDDAIRLKCPDCGANRILWAAPDQQEIACPVCGRMVPVERPAAEQGQAMDVAPDASDAAVPPAPGKLDVSLPPESAAVAYGPPMMGLMPYGMMPMLPPPPPRPRPVTAVVVLLALETVAGLALGLAQFFVPELRDSELLISGGRPDMGLLGAFLVSAFAVAGLAITSLVLLLIWTYRVHQDMEVLTAGTHSPSPGLAMGLLFVPVMHPFWLWHVLRQLSNRVSGPRHANGTTGGPAVVGRTPLGIFLALSALALAAVPISIVVTLNMQSVGRLTTEFVILTSVVLGVDLLASACQAVALWQIGREAAAFTAAQTAQLAPAVPGQMGYPMVGKAF